MTKKHLLPLLLLLSFSLSHALLKPTNLNPKERPNTDNHPASHLSSSVLAERIQLGTLLKSRNQDTTVKNNSPPASLKRTSTVHSPKQRRLAHQRTSNRLSFDQILRQTSGGLTGDSCEAAVDCQGTRVCACSNDSSICVCLPSNGPLECMSATECPFGEVCVHLEGVEKFFCLSEDLAPRSSNITIVGTVLNTPTASPVANSGNGYNGLSGDVCTFDFNCADTRECDCSSSRIRCLCKPKFGFRLCSSSPACPLGEVCLYSPNDEASFCLSKGFQTQSGWEETGVSSTASHAPTRTPTPTPTPTRTRTPAPTPTRTRTPAPTPTPTPTRTRTPAPTPTRTRTPAPTTPTTTSPTTTSPTTTPPTGSGVRLTGDRCGSGSDCAHKRVCRCDPKPCVCFPVSGKSVRCKDTEDCPTGEICVEKLPLDGGAQACTSKSYAKSNDLKEIPAITTEDVCVALYHLEDHGVELEDRVFDRDYRAWVLCDRWGSCATRGHMVMWKGQGMMMKSYCSVVGCDRKSMLVNSMRYKRKGCIGSRSQGLDFSVFAAKWATRTEETVLNGLIRMGL